jgi:hypothetical protein
MPNAKNIEEMLVKLDGVKKFYFLFEIWNRLIDASFETDYEALNKWYYFDKVYPELDQS